MGVVGGHAVFYDEIFMSQRPLDAFNFLFRTGVLSELKIVTSFFVKSVDRSELHSCLFESSLVLLRFGYA